MRPIPTTTKKDGFEISKIMPICAFGFECHRFATRQLSEGTKPHPRLAESVKFAFSRLEAFLGKAVLAFKDGAADMLKILKELCDSATLKSFTELLNNTEAVLSTATDASALLQLTQGDLARFPEDKPYTARKSI